MRVVLITLFSLLVAAEIAHAIDKTLVLDDNEQEIDISQIAKQVICYKKSALAEKAIIGRVSTISKLADYFEELLGQVDRSNSDEGMVACARMYLDQVNDLKRVVTLSNENACADSKIALIQEFHEKYLSTVAKNVEHREAANQKPLSWCLKVFFMYYALEVGSICKRNLINNLVWDVNNKLKESDYQLSNGNNLNNIMFGLGEHFSAMKSVNSYDDIIMIWNIIDGSLLAKENSEILKSSSATKQDEIHAIKLDNGLNEITGSQIKLFVKSKNPNSMLSLQYKCSRKFKPIYSKLILPIIELADLGYSLEDESFERELNELKENETVKRWYVITQICETVLPIKFILDSSLVTNEMVMITKEEADEISLKEEQPKVLASQKEEEEEEEAMIEYEPSTNSMLGLDRLTLLESIHVTKMMQSIKINLTARERSIRRLIKRFAKSALDFVKSKANIMISFSRKVFNTSKNSTELNQVKQQHHEASYVKQDMRDMITNTLENIDEEAMLGLQGSVKRRPETKVINHHIERHKNRIRPVDVAADRETAARILSYQHTKSIGQIIGEWWFGLQSLAPSRAVIFLVGTVTCLVLLVIILLTSGIISIG